MQILFKRLFLSSLMFLCFTLLTDASKNDSIPADISQIKDTATISRIIKYAKEISKTNNDSAEILFILSEKASKSINDDKKIIISLYEYGYFLFMKGKYDKAFIKLQQSYDKSFQINFKKYLYFSKLYIGTIYMIKSNYNLATDYMLECMEYFEKQKDYEIIAGIYLNLTYIQIEQNDILTAEEYANLSYDNAVMCNHKIYQSKSLLNIGTINFLNSEYSEAMNYYRQSLKITDSINYEGSKIILFLNMGEAFRELNQLDSAEFYAGKVINYNNNNYAGVFILPKAYILLSEIFELKNDYKKAKYNAHKALIFSDSAQFFQISALAYNQLSRVYEKTEDYKIALKYKTISTKINDSIFTAEKYKIQNELEAVYENTKKKKAIEELSKENEIRKLKNQRTVFIVYLLIFVILIAILTAVLIFKQNKNKAQRESAELEQKLLRTQMNPHFIFNSISAIQDFILNNNPLEASSYLSDFAKLMRAILINSSDNFISLENELETVENYLKLQHLRVSEKFDYKIIVSELIDSEDYNVPPMLMQPFIENSIIHGFMKKNDKKGLITVSYSLSGDFLIMETQDNGIGRKSSKEHNKTNHKSKAIEITNQRINLLSKKYKQHITFEIIDLKDSQNIPSGTLVRFKLPII